MGGRADFREKVATVQERRDKLQNRRGERGFVLLVMGVTAVVVAGILGLAMDVGRTYIAKNEAQAYADAGALAAVEQGLAGTNLQNRSQKREALFTCA